MRGSEGKVIITISILMLFPFFPREWNAKISIPKEKLQNEIPKFISRRKNYRMKYQNLYPEWNFSWDQLTIIRTHISYNQGSNKRPAVWSHHSAWFRSYFGVSSEFPFSVSLVVAIWMWPFKQMPSYFVKPASFPDCILSVKWRWNKKIENYACYLDRYHWI